VKAGFAQQIGAGTQKAHRGRQEAQRRSLCLFVVPFCAFCVPAPICWAKPQKRTRLPGEHPLALTPI